MSEYPEIEFEDIRNGDKIRASYCIGDVKETRTGVVASLRDGRPRSPQGLNLYANIDEANIYLLDRPKPVLPTEPGSVIIATEVRGLKGRWLLMLMDDDDWVSAKSVSVFRYHKPEHITEWEPAEVRQVGAE